MKNYLFFLVSLSLIFFSLGSCQEDEAEEVERIQLVDPNEGDPSDDLGQINFTNWKVTLPVDTNNDSKPDEYFPSQLKDGGYRSLEPLQGWMYDDSDADGILFHVTYSGAGATTTNSPYPRTELRELINTSNSRDNWNLASGGEMRLRMKVVHATDNYGTGSLNKDRFIIAQIHGIVPPAEMSRLGLSSDSAPPLLKMQWRDGYLYAYKKTLRDENTTGDDLYSRSNTIWTDISHNFGYVGYEPFDLEIKASAGRLDVEVNGNTHVFQDVSLAKWKFDSYFKAGVYMQSTDERSAATVKLYALEVTH
ncbi:polysaccharide lyase family 7 protein [Nonlabens xiamenensis]|uniref:polysaccharide lyase family 7 protein n=1 Tax=Nonlabens xiamenensis TaxID=2341043 RepID=UPI0013DE34D8|nr:polysaccharide lyase family 7 protein [Nonlabens xiamenensis]